MRAIHYLTLLGFAATLGVAAPASAVTTVKIVDTAGNWLNYTSYRSFPGTLVQVFGASWTCYGAQGPVSYQFAGGADGANCSATGGGVTVYKSGGEWYADYP